MAIEDARIWQRDRKALFLQHSDTQARGMCRSIKDLRNPLVGQEVRFIQDHGQELDPVHEAVILEISDRSRIDATHILRTNSVRLTPTLVQEFALDHADDVAKASGD
ncbi:hypothetical protein D3C81_1221850 [compost metagenome]